MSRVNLIVLGLLMEQPMHGYKIVSFFEKRGLVFWTKVKIASVYKALQRLEKKGYIVGEMKQEEHNPPKKVFTITEDGHQHFLKILRNFLFQEDVQASPMDFWHAVRFVKNNITRSEFIRALSIHEQKIRELMASILEKRQKVMQKEDASTFPFYVEIMMNKMNEIMKVQLQTISELQENAVLPENLKDFSEEV
ncbi:MAG: PadR family transcriptional regulator [Candidatus Cloacimonetes bacterium]|nr:PadR family transcriptional regulator [Candidatus Cloacimonadota bacterium]